MTISPEAAATVRSTRESWLESAIDAFRPRFEEIGMPLPERIHVSVGFGYGARRESAVILGQCWAKTASADGVNHVFISPELGDTAEVLAVLLHELIHAADDVQHGHKGPFAEAAVRLGLEGPMTATRASVELAFEMVAMAATLGDYPHGALQTVLAKVPTAPTPKGEPTPRVHSGPAKQGTRMRKVTCRAHVEDGECGYTVRTTSKWLEIGLPGCPLHGEMQLAD